MKWYKRLPRAGQFVVTMIIGLLLTAAFLIMCYSMAGIIDLRNYGKRTVPDILPDYDPDYRLEWSEEGPTKEDLAYYIATKLPDSMHESYKGINHIDQNDIVFIEADPNYTGDSNPFTAPYEGSIVVGESTSYEVLVHVDIDGTGTEAECSEIVSEIENGSDYPFGQVRFRYSNGGIYGTGGWNGTKYVLKSEYTKYISDYTVQSSE